MAKPDKKSPFYLSHEKRTAFRFSEEPIPISEIANRIDELADSADMKKFCYKDLRKWLVSVGMLQVLISADGKNTFVPSEKGERLGISLGKRHNKSGTRTPVLYNSDAQRYILDNLDAVMGA